MRLTRLEARDWMAYDDIDIEFDADAFAVTGDNNMGKSALQNAVTMALYGRVGRDIDQRSADLLSRRGSGGFRVAVTFEVDGKTVTVTREKPLGRTMTLGLVVDGESQRGHTIDDSQARIDDLVGLTYEQLVAGPFMVQQGAESVATSFLKAKPAARKDLLIRLLRLDAYEPLYLAAKAKADEYREVELAAGMEVARLETALEGTASVEDDLDAARTTAAFLAERTASARQTAADATAAHHEALVAQLAQRAALERLQRAREAATHHGERVPAIRAAIVDVEAQRTPPPERAATVEASNEDIEETGDALKAAQEAANYRATLVSQFAALDAEVTRAERARAILPTVPCGGTGKYASCQFLVDVPTAADVTAARESMERTRLTLTASASVESELVTAQKRWDAILDQQRNHMDAEREYRSAHAVWAANEKRIDEVLVMHRDSLASAEAALDDAVAEGGLALQAAQALGVAPDKAVDLTVLEEAGVQARTAVVLAEDAERAAQAALLELERRQAVREQAWNDLEAQKTRSRKAGRIAGVYRSLEAAWHRDGVPTALLEQAVPLIESRANAVLTRFPQDMSVRLRTQRPTKGGKMAEKLDVVVTIGGEESDPGLLSVGANFRLDIALRMALTGLHGRAADTLWLDEPLAALDATGREAVVATLGALRADFGLMVVVSHHMDFNDVLPARLDITQEGGVAHVTRS